MLKSFASVVIMSVWFVIANPSLSAQTTIPNQVTPNTATGMQPYGTYGGVRETISFATGNLNLQIPLYAIPGRDGHSYALSLIYDSKIWDLHNYGDPNTGGVYQYDSDIVTGSGLRFNIPVLLSEDRYISPRSNPTLHCTTDFIFISEDGAKHGFNYQASGPKVNCANNLPGHTPVPCPSCAVNQGDDLHSAYIHLDATNQNDTVVTTKNGTRYHFSLAAALISIEDTNGNLITFTGQTFAPQAITDTLKRQLSVTGQYPKTISYLDSSGATQNITLSYTLINIAPTFNFSPDGNPTPTTSRFITSITFPNNRSYNFQYNNFGEMTRISYPTGGYTRYDYAPFSAWYQAPVASNGDFRELTAKHVCYDPQGSCSTSTEVTTSYTPTIPGGGTSNQYVDVLEPLGRLTHYQFSFGSGVAAQPYGSPRELVRTVSDSGRPLYSVATTYNNLDSSGRPTDASLPLTRITTLTDVTPNLMKETSWAYDTFNGSSIDNVTTENEYDYGSGSVGPLLRQTLGTFLKTNSVNGVDYTAGAIHILNRKLTERIKNSGGTIIAQSQYEYDNYAATANHVPIQATGAVQHDATRGTSYSVRGNVTSAQHWRNTDGVWLASYNQYDDAGNVLKMIDPRGNPTTYRYADSWGNASCTPSGGNGAAYPTTVSNALAQASHASYNSCTGTFATSVDVNNQTTTYAYDALGRRTQTTLPLDPSNSHPITSVTYNETSLPLSVTTSSTITTSTNYVSVVNVDGVGRATQSTVSSDPEGAVYTATTYDALERVNQSYNPTRCSPPTSNCGENTWGYNTTNYDAMNRPVSVTKQDGSISAAAYSGNCSTATDEALKSRKSCTDGVGRLTSASEDPTGLNYITSYGYDVLNNLTSVAQVGSRQRTFTYNSLSQLLTSANPESGTITYTYDNNGNVLTKTDARNVKKTYTYDALNRNTQKSYSDGTPTANFYFDAAPSVWNGNEQNTVGRLVEATTPSTATEFSYDSVGRIIGRYVCTPLNCTVGANGQTGTGWLYLYTYNLAGGVTQFLDGIYIWPQYLNQTFDGAGRVTQLTSTANDANHPAILFTADATNGYWPNGELRKATLGNGLTLSNVYDKRLQPCLMDVNNNGTLLQTCNDSTPPGNVLDLAMNYNLGVSDNGNVTSWNATGAQSFVRTYSYDALNRVKTMGDTVAAQPCKGLSWTYDTWGNRTDQTVTSGTCGTFHNPVDVNNRFTGAPYQYDAAGNMTHDASHSYAYDAENRVKSVDGGATATYIYDAFGRRAKRTVGANSYEYTYDNEGNIGWEILNGVENRGYVRSNGRLIAEYFEGTTYFAHADHLGSTRLLTRMDKTVRECDDYYPYGESNACGVTTGTPLKFTGKERDSESGLDNLGARYYGATLGRFMTTDPLDASAHPGNPQSWNRYEYAFNNPLKFVDVKGKCSAPVVGNGQVGICVDLYISSRTINGLGLGDHRGPLSNGGTYRSEMQFVVEPKKGSVTMTKNDAGVSKAIVPLPPIPFIVENKGTSNTNVSQPTTDDKGTTHFNVSNEALNGLSFLPGAPKDSIKTSIDLDVTQEGKVGVEGGTRTAYPSLEVFSYDSSGKATQVLTIQETTPDALKKQDQKIPEVDPK